MALLLNHAILHIVDNSGFGTYSSQELDVDSETCYEFVGKHVRRLIGNPGAREAVFSAESELYGIVKAFQKGNIYFKDMSLKICERLSGIMKDNSDIAPADILVAAFDNKGTSYIAIIKLGYGECFTHRIVEGGQGAENQIIKNTAVLPLGAGKVEEACLIPYDPMVLRILEKPRKVNGEERNYFSELFLECEAERSQKETLELIGDIVSEINERCFDGNLEAAANMKCVIMNESDTSGEEDLLNLQNVAAKIFESNETAKEEFIGLAKEYDIPYEVRLDKSLVRKEFKTERFKADNGVEIKFPVELLRDPDTMVYTTNSDGSVSITFKNLRLA